MERAKSYSVDLIRIRGKGEFKCPKCGIEISPDDRTETAYTILVPVMRRNRLDEIVLQCNGCGSIIHLTGFHITK